MFVDHPGDVLRIGGLPRSWLLRLAANVAAGWLGETRAHRHTGNDFIQRGRQLAFHFALPLITDAELIVDPAVIEDATFWIEHKGFGRASRTELVRDFGGNVFEQRKVDLVDASVMTNLEQRILFVGIDADEGDALWSILGREFVQPRAVEFGERALGAEKHDDNRFVLAQIFERVAGAEIILQREVADRGAHLRRRRSDGIRRPESKYQQ